MRRDCTFTKAERLSKQKSIERLFAGKSKTLVAFPIRLVYTSIKDEPDARTAVLVSVSKKRFHHAVQRNRVKRQLREAYRVYKEPMLKVLERRDEKLALAFIWLDNKLHSQAKVKMKMKQLLKSVSKKV